MCKSVLVQLAVSYCYSRNPYEVSYFLVTCVLLIAANHSELLKQDENLHVYNMIVRLQGIFEK